MKTVAFAERRIFDNREDAGKLLFNSFKDYLSTELTLVAIPNGGVVVASIIAVLTKKTLKVAISKKVALADMRIIGLGAIAHNHILLNEERIQKLQLSKAQICTSVKETQMLKTKDEAILKDYLVSANDIRDKAVCIIDDGVSSGYTMLAAIKEIMEYYPKNITVLTPVIHNNASNLLEQLGINVYALYIDDKTKYVVDDFYTFFEYVSSFQAREMLERVNNKYEIRVFE